MWFVYLNCDLAYINIYIVMLKETMECIIVIKRGSFILILCLMVKLDSLNRIGGVMVRRDRLGCGRSWVRAPVGLKQRL